MDAAGLVVSTGLVASAVMALVTLALVLRAAPSLPRYVATALMAMVLAASMLMLASISGRSGALTLPIALSADLIIYWSIPVILHLVLSAVWFRGREPSPCLTFAIYLPMTVLTLVLAAGGVAYPTNIKLVESTTPPWADLGAMNALFIVISFAYLVIIILTILMGLSSGARGLRVELLGLLGTLVVVCALMAVTTSFPSVSYSGLFAPLGSLLGLILCRAVLAQSDFIQPRREKVVEEKTVTLLPSGTYLFLNDRGQARELFALYVKSGTQGIWVTRRPPAEAREAFGLKETPFVWLTGKTVPGENCVNPQDIGRLGRLILAFIESAKDYIILIEGLEYLSSSVGFSSVLSLVHMLNDKVMSSKGILIFGFDPRVFKESELANLRSEATQVFEEPFDSGDKRPERGGEARPFESG